MELTKEILGEDLANQVTTSTDVTLKAVVEKLKGVKILLGDATTWVPKSEFNEKLEALKAAKEQIKGHEDALKVLNEKAAGNTALQSQIAELQRTNKEAKDRFEADALRAKKSLALSIALMDNGVGDPAARELLSKSFDVDKLELDETGKPKGLDVLLKPMKENPAFKGMFGTVRMAGQEHVIGDVVEPLPELEAKLIAAQKAGRPFVEVIALKRQIAEAQQKT